MDLKNILETLTGDEKLKFLEQFLRSSKLVNEENFQTASKEAAELSPKLGASYLLTRKLSEEAISLLEDSEYFEDAAKLCVDFGFNTRAVDNYIKNNDYENAYKLSAEFDLLKSAEILENWKGPGDAADYLFRLAQQSEDAQIILSLCASAYQRNNSLHSAGACFYSAGDLESSLECYKEVNCHQRVHGILEELDRKEELVQYWKDNKSHQALAEYYEAQEEFLDAANRYELINEFSDAARCLVKDKKELEAAWLLYSVQSYDKCIELIESLGTQRVTNQIKETMNNCYEQLGSASESSDPKTALGYYQKSGNKSKVSELANLLMETEAAAGNFEDAINYARLCCNKKNVALYESAQNFLS